MQENWGRVAKVGVRGRVVDGDTIFRMRKKADEARQESEENPEEVYEQEMNDFVRDEIDRFEPGLDGM